ncbi:MAG: tRNA (adenosine(37)-N6)-threonylcarbamoyltransferase complex dimerization subunit type 1 TsaB [Chromatiales bacterium]|nr:tRNA (adenosine(37)-N6)-threonylcarbamoyltransferase complex dimerization subunit type 1 TsaB [Chromatiales bacterium]
MKLLAVDTSTEACSAALYIDGETLGRFRIAPRDHTRLILPMIEEVMAEAGVARGELDALALGRGPGSFTGVRIGTGVVQGLALALDLPVVPVSTLAAMAWGALRGAESTRVHAVIDARMGEVYYAAYERADRGVREVAAERVCAADSVPEDVVDAIGVGTGWGAYRDALSTRLARVADVRAEFFPDARDIAELAAPIAAQGGGVAPELALPVYLRNQVTHAAARQ